MKSSEETLQARLAEAAATCEASASEQTTMAAEREELASAREAFAADRARAEKDFNDRRHALELAEASLHAKLESAEATQTETRLSAERFAKREEVLARREKAVQEAEERSAKLAQELKLERARYEEQAELTRTEYTAANEARKQATEALKLREDELSRREKRVARAEVAREELDKKVGALALDASALAKARGEHALQAEKLESDLRDLRAREKEVRATELRVSEAERQLALDKEASMEEDKRVAELARVLRVREESLHAQMQSLNQARESHLAEASELAQARASHKDAVRRLESHEAEVATREEAAATMGRRHAEGTERVGRLEKELTAEKESLAALKGETAALHERALKDAADAKEAETRAAKMLAEIDPEREHVSKARKELERDIALFRRECATKADELSAANRETEQAQKLLDADRAIVAKEQDRLSKLVAAAASKEASLMALDKEMRARKEKSERALLELQRKIREHEGRVASFEADETRRLNFVEETKERAEKLLAEAESSERHAQEQLLQSAQKVESNQGELRREQQQLLEDRRECDALAAKLSAETAAAAKLDAHMQAEKASLESSRKEVEALRDSLNREKRVIEEQIAALKVRDDAATRREKSLGSAESAAERRRSQVEGLQARLVSEWGGKEERLQEQFRRTIDTLKADLSRAQLRAEEAERAVAGHKDAEAALRSAHQVDLEKVKAEHVKELQEKALEAERAELKRKEADGTRQRAAREELDQAKAAAAKELQEVTLRERELLGKFETAIERVRDLTSAVNELSADNDALRQQTALSSDAVARVKEENAAKISGLQLQCAQLETLLAASRHRAAEVELRSTELNEIAALRREANAEVRAARGVVDALVADRGSAPIAPALPAPGTSAQGATTSGRGSTLPLDLQQTLSTMTQSIAQQVRTGEERLNRLKALLGKLGGLGADAVAIAGAASAAALLGSQLEELRAAASALGARSLGVREDGDFLPFVQALEAHQQRAETWETALEARLSEVAALQASRLPSTPATVARKLRY